jgi:hypothetical protein
MCDVDAVSYRRHGANVTNDAAAVRAAQLEVIARKLARAKAGKTA